MFDLLREAPSSSETSGTSEASPSQKSHLGSVTRITINGLTMDNEAGRGRHEAVVEAGGRGRASKAGDGGLGPRPGSDLASGLACLAPDLR